ncbi:General negative regulator of transcription subunit 3 [Lecanosticta acicola]|uniref:General negative regulator of transcription subunit n=1 Tax=Lecanosticta acicola TaxID=111012 RepID=A0AAI8Z6I0_9PEZI|nr:General negative regulator of transcription subunit 3 [Lecanosticta acicola]
MAARKLQQEMDKEFKRVAEGVQLFESIYEKLIQSTNPSQKEKLEDSLKKEIKKLQRSRDKIKGWASQNDIKDKKPLLDQRKLIETQMEKFKAVEKEMKTKAFSKEGLSAAAKLDPKEKEKMETCNFVSDMVDDLGRQVETLEAEVDTLQAGMKKKKGSGNADRVAELEKWVEKHKWHISKLEILLRSLENGSVDVEQVKEIEEGIRYYVEQNQEVDFNEDEGLFDDLNLDEEEESYGIANDNDKVSSQDTQSIQEEPAESEAPSRTSTTGNIKGKSASIDANANGRRSSVQLKSPLPVLSSLHSLPSNVNGKAADTMKPAPLPTIPTGQPLKYASAAAAAAASDKNGVGIAPLPPPPGAAKPSEPTSPAPTPSQPVEPQTKAPEQPPKQPTPVSKEEAKVEPAETTSKASSVKPSPQVPQAQPSQSEASSVKMPQPPSPDSGIAGIALSHGEPGQDDEEESIYHLPSLLTDLLDSFEETRQRVKSDQPFDTNVLNASRMSCPIPSDAEKPNHYKPQNPFNYTPAHYPQEPLGIFDDNRLYSRIDTDSLFYAFYYRQGTYQQYLAAKALKSQSWRFHKQYQTWFQRHEEPKNITEEFEQGTYRFFDYESTWMNRRKADFKFAYKFLEDDL